MPRIKIKVKSDMSFKWRTKKLEACREGHISPIIYTEEPGPNYIPAGGHGAGHFLPITKSQLRSSFARKWARIDIR
jgi:hypothetical protein